MMMNGSSCRNLSFFWILLILSVMASACGGLAGDSDTEENDSDGTESGEDLATLINDYRVEQGLAAIPLSASLTQVAEAHVNDLEENNPDTGDCTLHSWSENGDWTTCCYTADNAEAECMWMKPEEITGGVYASEGYEIAALHTSSMNPERALDLWQSSDAHHDVILNRDDWAAVEWKAMGVGISAHYAVAWFGTEDDPAGTP